MKIIKNNFCDSFKLIYGGFCSTDRGDNVFTCDHLRIEYLSFEFISFDCLFILDNSKLKYKYFYQIY